MKSITPRFFIVCETKLLLVIPSPSQSSILFIKITLNHKEATKNNVKEEETNKLKIQIKKLSEIISARYNLPYND